MNPILPLLAGIGASVLAGLLSPKARCAWVLYRALEWCWPRKW